MLFRSIFLFFLFVSFVYSEGGEYNFYKENSSANIEKRIEEKSLNSADVDRWLRKLPSGEQLSPKILSRDSGKNLRQVEIILSSGDILFGEISFSGEKIFSDGGIFIAREDVKHISFYDWGVIYSFVLNSTGGRKYYFGPRMALIVTVEGKEYRTKINPFDFSHFFLKGVGVYSIFFFDIWSSDLSKEGSWKFAKSSDKNYYTQRVAGKVVKEVKFFPQRLDESKARK